MPVSLFEAKIFEMLAEKIELVKEIVLNLAKVYLGDAPEPEFEKMSHIPVERYLQPGQLGRKVCAAIYQHNLVYRDF